MASLGLTRPSAAFFLGPRILWADAFDVLELTGHEGISALFEIAVTIATKAPLDAAPVGERASLVLASEARERTVSGIVRAFEQGDAHDGRFTYRVTLAPSAYVLALREDRRVFQGRSAPEIIESVLTAAGLTTKDYRIALSGEYPPRDYRVQYREADWTFLLRLMEAEGIYAFFDRDGANEVLVFADAPSADPRIAEGSTLPFRQAESGLADREAVTRFRHVEELSLEREKAGRGIAHGTSNIVELRPGAIFELSDHASDSLNRTWLVTSVIHSFATGTAPYENRFTAVVADIPFRMQPVTPKPVIGIQTAAVVGPAGQEIHCDELGQVKVRFNWDREGSLGEKSSWVRVSQPWASGGSGAMFIPRVGDQVLVDFEGGDCDRPIVVGSVHDGVNKPPLALPFERTAAVIRSTSSPGGDGYSELRLDADSGREHVLLRSSRDLALEVLQDKNERVARDEVVDVGGGSKRSVAGDESISVRGAQRIGSSSFERKVGGDASTAIGGGEKYEVRGHKTEIVGQSLHQQVGSDDTREVSGKSHLSVKGPMSVEAERYDLDVREDIKTVVEGGHSERAHVRNIEARDIVVDGERVTVDAKRELVLRCGNASITLTRSGKIIVRGTHLVSKSSGANRVLGSIVRIN
ncbi:MAG: type VI secretion system tip protein VgrG [Polyangiaceae bacterium]|nr:type VI secretion system tip protein VgrG [Polyangiaceae bacterium]